MMKQSSTVVVAAPIPPPIPSNNDKEIDDNEKKMIEQIHSRKLEKLSFWIKQLNLARPTLDEIKQILFKLKKESKIIDKLEWFRDIFEDTDAEYLEECKDDIEEDFNYDILNYHRLSSKFASTKTFGDLQRSGNIKLVTTNGDTSMIVHKTDDVKQLLIKNNLNNQLISEIDELESRCIDMRMLDTDTYSIKKKPAKATAAQKNVKNINDGGNYILNILDPLLNMNLENGFMIPTLVMINDKKESKILHDINNLPMKLYPNFYNILSKIFDQFIPLFEQLLSCYLKNCIIDVIFQIQYYFIHPNTSYDGLYHREGYKDGEYIDAGGIYYFYKTPNVFKQDIFEIESTKGSRANNQVEIKQGTCIVFENNIINHRLKTLVNENKNGIIGKRGVLNFFLPKIKINSTISPINIDNVNKNFYKNEKIVSYFVRQFNNNKSNIVLSVNKNIEMLIVKYLYLVANDQDYHDRNKFAKQRQGTKNRGKRNKN